MRGSLGSQGLKRGNLYCKKDHDFILGYEEAYERYDTSVWQIL